MKIAIDGVRLTKKPTGVTDITISIINSFSNAFPEFYLYILVNQNLHPEVENKIYKNNNLYIVNDALPFAKNNGLLWTLFKLNKMVDRINPDLFIEPNFLFNPIFFPKTTKVITYVHDVVFKEHPETMELVTRVYMKCFLNATLKRSDIIWTNSNYTQQRLLHYYPYYIKNAKLFKGSGVNPFLLKKANEVDITKWDKIPFSAGDKYLLFVGTIEPRKNIPFLLKLFQKIHIKGYKLIIAGNKGWGAASKEVDLILNEADYPKENVIFTGYVSSEDLIRLYKNAYIFISTSSNEGLGLPQLEAMACGCPVISPHNSAMIEVVEHSGITVKTWALQEWESAIEKIEKNRDYYVKCGYEKLKTYNWDVVIKDFYDFLQH